MKPNYCLNELSPWELESRSEIEALRAMTLDDSGSQYLNEFEVSVDDKIRVKRGIQSGKVSRVEWWNLQSDSSL